MKVLLRYSCWPEQVRESPAFLTLSSAWHLGSVKIVFPPHEQRKVSLGSVGQVARLVPTYVVQKCQ